MLPTGKVEVVTGSSAHGQGHETAWSQIVADQLGVPFEDIRVLHGDTQVSPKGMDTYGSRSLAVGGMALVSRLRQGHREGQGDRRRHARGRRQTTWSGRPGGGRSAATRTRASRSPRSRWPPSPRTTCPTASSRPRRRRHLRPGQLLLPARHPPVRDGSRHRDRLGHDPLLRRRRRHRPGGQPADRRGPGPRRPRPGHRAGAVRGGRLRRRRQPDHHHPGRLPDPVSGRPALLRHRPDREPGRATGSASRASARPGTIASTPAVVNAIVDALRPLGIADITMPCTPERVWRAIHSARSGDSNARQTGGAA